MIFGYNNFYSNKNLLTVNINYNLQDIDFNNRYIAFTGIARPQKFYQSLKQCDLTVLETKSFPDHYAYSEKDLSYLESIASQNNAKLVTTEKDSMRLPKWFRDKVDVLQILFQVEQEAEFKSYLENELALFIK